MISTIASEPVRVFETCEPVRESAPAVRPKIRKPRVWTTIAGLFFAVIVGQLASILALVAVGVGLGIVLGAQGAGGDQIQTRIQEILQRPVPALLLCLIPAQLGMAAGLLYAARRSKEPIKQRLGFLPQMGRVVGRLKLVTLAAVTFSASLVFLVLSHLLTRAAPTQNVIGAAINDGSWRAVTLLSIILSILPALVEEALFRGYLQRRLLQRWSPAVAIGVSTLLFALLHFDSVHHMFGVVPLGVITGLLAYRTNSIKPGMLVHGIHNATVVGYASLAKVLPSDVSPDTIAVFALGVIVVMGLIGLPAVISLLRRQRPLPPVETHAASTMAVDFLSAPDRAVNLRRSESALAGSAL